MIKIIDNIDLSELKKYGFKNVKNYYKRITEEYDDTKHLMKITTKVYKEDRHIDTYIEKYYSDCSIYFYNTDIGINDLIKDKLVVELNNDLWGERWEIKERKLR